MGDVMSFMAACCSALFIIQMSIISKFQKNINMTNSIYLMTTTILFATTSFEKFETSNIHNTIGILYLGLVSYIGQYLQTYGQEKVEASKAALIFALDPLYNIVWAHLFLNEKISSYCAIGMTFLSVAIFAI